MVQGHIYCVISRYIDYCDRATRITVVVYLAPLEGPTVTVTKSKKNSAELTWEEIPLEKQQGFITNYTIFYAIGNTKQRKRMFNTSWMCDVCCFLELICVECVWQEWRWLLTSIHTCWRIWPVKPITWLTSWRQQKQAQSKARSLLSKRWSTVSLSSSFECFVDAEVRWAAEGCELCWCSLDCRWWRGGGDCCGGLPQLPVPDRLFHNALSSEERSVSQCCSPLKMKHKARIQLSVHFREALVWKCM